MLLCKTVFLQDFPSIIIQVIQQSKQYYYQNKHSYQYKRGVTSLRQQQEEDGILEDGNDGANIDNNDVDNNPINLEMMSPLSPDATENNENTQEEALNIFTYFRNVYWNEFNKVNDKYRLVDKVVVVVVVVTIKKHHQCHLYWNR